MVQIPNGLSSPGTIINNNNNNCSVVESETIQVKNNNNINRNVTFSDVDEVELDSLECDSHPQPPPQPPPPRMPIVLSSIHSIIQMVIIVLSDSINHSRPPQRRQQHANEWTSATRASRRSQRLFYSPQTLSKNYWLAKINSRRSR